MRLYQRTLRQLCGVAHGFAVVGRDAVAAAQQAFWVFCLNALCEQFKTVAFGVYLALGCGLYRALQSVESRFRRSEAATHGCGYALHEAVGSAPLLRLHEREEHGYALRHRRQTHTLHIHAALHAVGYAVGCLVDELRRALQIVDEMLGGGCRRLHACERHHVEHTLVTLMTDTGNDGQREVGYVLCQGECVEARHIARGTSAAYYHHGVEVVHALVYASEGGYHALLHGFALHDGAEELHLIYISCLIVVQLAAEVAVAGCSFARYDGYALCEHRQPQLFLQVEHAFCLQLSHYLLPAPCQVAHGVLGIDVAHYPREAVGGMKLRTHAQQHLHASVQPLTSDALELGAQQRPSRRPALG